MKNLSLLYPGDKPPVYQELPTDTAHDLGLEELCCRLTDKEAERLIIYRYMTRITADPEIAEYRAEIFDDILRLPALRKQMQDILERVDFLKNFAGFTKTSDASGIWELVHRLDEMDEFISCLTAIAEGLSVSGVRSQGLLRLKEYAESMYRDHGFAELRKDIAALKAETSKVKSVTLGVNLNERYEPCGVGIISVNGKSFAKSNVISNFSDFLSRGDAIRPEAGWDGNYVFHPAKEEEFEFSDKTAAIFAGSGLAAISSIALLTQESHGAEVVRTLDRAISLMIEKIVKKLKRILSRHVAVSTREIAGLIPEFMYYIRWAEYIERLQAAGFVFCRPQILEEESYISMDARGFYNLRLAHEVMTAGDGRTAEDVVPNDLDFSPEHAVYILTGANRGGKTTATQAVGTLFLLAQGGIYVPAREFSFRPADNLFTHYPADENKTLDLGRLGEESKRFREIYQKATGKSLLLLNESFSTTSFEEGFYIARDVVRALKHLGARTIYNTHMHKLAAEIDDLNRREETNYMAASPVVEAEGGCRSYHLAVAPPGGSSYARDIAEKYGVTFDQLMAETT